MKKTIVTTLVITILTVFSANAQKAMDNFLVQVDGLGCPFCAYGLEKKFKEFKGIKQVKIDIETGDFSFSYPSEKALSMEAVTKQVEKAGYTPVTSKIVRADGTVEESGSKPINRESAASLQEKQVRVAGNCGMCEARITKAAMDVTGVVGATWDKETKLLSVSFDQDKASMSDIEKAIAKVGHDTKNHAAKTDTYGNLPACCHYERIQ
ncbi:heavy-metal-associated domain-containing protein [Spongiimicrobium sp. 3-5]|uniref:heavy-metal-associated domain-containing protein n=1 Tax=Spongiimicrobium sp. 3-5 TaxID=3332596 RepID=UPI00397F1B23